LSDSLAGVVIEILLPNRGGTIRALCSIAGPVDRGGRLDTLAENRSVHSRSSETPEAVWLAVPVRLTVSRVGEAL
jgi:hypothetical protein